MTIFTFEYIDNQFQIVIDLTNIVDRDELFEKINNMLGKGQGFYQGVMAARVDSDNYMEFNVQEDFLLELVGLSSSSGFNDITDEVLSNITSIESSNISLEIWEAGQEVLGNHTSFDTIEEHVKENYEGHFEDDASFAEEKSSEDLANIPNYLKNCIDWDDVFTSEYRHYYSSHDGHYFRD